MLGTRDDAARKFAQFVKLAKGNSYIVYQAFSQLDQPTDSDIAEFIKKRLAELQLKQEQTDEAA